MAFKVGQYELWICKRMPEKDIRSDMLLVLHTNIEDYQIQGDRKITPNRVLLKEMIEYVQAKDDLLNAAQHGSTCITEI